MFLNIFKNKTRVFLYFVFINLPLFILTFDTTNWSDDYQYTNLIALKARISPVLSVILDTTGGNTQGGHFAPVYNLINIVITAISTDPRFFHFIVLLCYVVTAFLVYLIVMEYYGDKAAALLAGTLFALNYYIAFKALNRNTFHSHATNTLTGAASIYFFVTYLKSKKKFRLGLSLLFLLVTFLNYESGFVFPLILLVIAGFALMCRQISWRKSIALGLVIILVTALFPLGAYLNTGKAVPLSYRFGWQRNAGGYAYNTTELFIKSTGLSFFYYKFIVDDFKHNPGLMENLKGWIRNNQPLRLKDIPAGPTFAVALSIALGIAFLVFMAMVALPAMRRQTYLFAAIYLCLLGVYIFVFYRFDVANAIAIFAAIVIADIIITLLRSKGVRRKAGLALISLYLIVTGAAIFDRFDDCYKKSFFGLSKVAIQGPEKIYIEINKQIGHYVKDGLIIFSHDYSRFHSYSGYERIGDMLGEGDLACFNAAVFYKEAIRDKSILEHKDDSLEGFARFISPKGKKVTVTSKIQALEYLRKNNIDTKSVAALYISPDYQVVKLVI